MRLSIAASAAVVSIAVTVYAPSPRGAGAAGSPWFSAGFTAAFLASLWAARLIDLAGRRNTGPAALRLIIGAAILMRLAALPATPRLSDDVYRYVWDGHVQRLGVNPYLHAPSDPALDRLEIPERQRINNPDLPTIYPPLMQMVFLAGAALPSPIHAMKLLMTAFDVGTLFLLVFMLRRRGDDPARVVLYAWSPLAILEVAWSGHNDPVGVFFVVAAAAASLAGARWLPVAAAALSTAAKYAGALALPPIVRRARGAAWLAAPAAIALLYAPYAGAGWRVFGSLPAYAERWRFNDSIFSVILALVERTGLSSGLRSLLSSAGWLDPAARWEESIVLRLTEPLSLAKLAALLLFAIVLIRVLRARWEDPIREVAALLGAALILAPTLHPWYLLWVAPFLAIELRLSWLWLTWAAPIFGYPMMAARTGADDDPLRWLVWVEYAPFFLILAVESARRRLWERG